MRAIFLVIATCLVGCQLGIESGVVVARTKHDSYTIMITTPMPDGGVTMSPLLIPEAYSVTVRGKRNGIEVTERVSTNSNFNGLQVGDAWKRTP